MAMSFMALEVIPKLKLTDQGLVDVDAVQDRRSVCWVMGCCFRVVGF
jgi:adenine deaminase